MREFYVVAGPGFMTSYRIALIQKTGSKFHQYTVLWWSGDIVGGIDGYDGDDDDNDNNNSVLVY
jgi:hypothetical protein